MSSLTFDTHKLILRLKRAGFPVEQAEAVSDVLKDAISEMAPVTRDYLDARLEAQKADIIKWLAGLLLAQAGLVAALVMLPLKFE